MHMYMYMHIYMCSKRNINRNVPVNNVWVLPEIRKKGKNNGA